MSMETIGIIGIGKLGLCFALNLEACGYNVIGLDRDPDYVEAVNAKTLQSHEPRVEEFLAKSKNFQATTDWDTLLSPLPRLIFIVVATPSLDGGGYDHSQVDAVLTAIRSRVQDSAATSHLVVMCTTMPGYCDTAAQTLSGTTLTLSYNPEFIAQGRIIQDQLYPDQILIGEANPEAGEAIEAVYRRMCRNTPSIHRMSRISAEITKLATNCFVTMKISFANAIGTLADKVGAEPDKILHAIGSDSRIGTKYLGYGFGYGGPCFPRDNRALAAFGAAQGFEILLSQATDEVNRRHLYTMLERWLETYPPHSPIRFEQVTYKPGTVILEESQQLALAVLLAENGRKVIVHEHPEVVRQVQARYGSLFDYEIRPEP